MFFPMLGRARQVRSVSSSRLRGRNGFGLGFTSMLPSSHSIGVHLKFHWNARKNAAKEAMLCLEEKKDEEEKFTGYLYLILHQR